LERLEGVPYASEKISEVDLGVGHSLISSKSTDKVRVCPTALRQSPHSGIFPIFVPPSTPQALFCTSSHPDHFLFLDIETFYPWGIDYPQPLDALPGKLLGRQNKGLAHPRAMDPRRCALRFLTIHDTEGTFGNGPLTIDFQAIEDLPTNVLDALATRTLVGHNLDFDRSFNLSR
jgi:hypothetical protein